MPRLRGALPGLAENSRSTWSVPVIVATRVHDGRALPVYGFKGGGNTLRKAGAVFAGDLTPDKARILTLIALPTGKEARKDQAALQAVFDK